MKRFIARGLLLTLGFSMLGACSTTSSTAPSTTSRPVSLSTDGALVQWPLLSPSMWAQDISVQQLLTIQAGGQQHQMQAVLDISNQAVHLVILKFGRRLVTIEHTDTGTRVDKEAYVPDFIDARQVLQDMQLVYAPLATIQATLPEQCRVTAASLTGDEGDEAGERRAIQCANQMVYQIDTRMVNGLASTRLNNVRVPYTIQIDTMQVQP